MPIIGKCNAAVFINKRIFILVIFVYIYIFKYLKFTIKRRYGQVYNCAQNFVLSYRIIIIATKASMSFRLRKEEEKT